MIYLDSAATSLLKPCGVSQAVLRAMNTMASPGRGGHAPAMRAADTVFQCRCQTAELFNVPEPQQVVFTSNATHGLNIAIRSLVSPGDRVVISGYEHNSVTRVLRDIGAVTDVASSPLFCQESAIEAFRQKIPGAKAVICNHVSNVFGFILPVYEIGELCQKYGVPYIVDLSQSAGCMDVDFERLGANFAAMPGHKGLLGPQGTGILLCGDLGKPFICGGTGSDSKNQNMPEMLPDRLEAGTHNVTGIAGLLAGINFAKNKTPEKIGAYEAKLCQKLAQSLSKIPELQVFCGENQAGVLSVRHKIMDCETICQALARENVAVRGGLHCSPLAHETGGTIETGTVRFSFSPFNRPWEIENTAIIMKKLITQGKNCN